MGQFLSIGILTNVTIHESDIPHLLPDTVIDALGREGIDPQIYSGRSEDDRWQGDLRPEIVKSELLDFLKSIYPIINQFCRVSDESEVIDCFSSNHPDKWPDLLNEVSYYTFQIDRYGMPFYIETQSRKVKVSFTSATLKVAGKIMMESDDGMFNLFGALLQERLAQFQLSKAIRVFITG